MESDLINNLEPRLIIDFLYENEVITQEEHNVFNDVETPRKNRSRQLLECIETRGDRAFVLFKQAIADKPELCEYYKQIKDERSFRIQSPRKRKRAGETEQNKLTKRPSVSKQYKRMRKETKQLILAPRVTRPVSSERKHIRYVEKAFDKLADMYNNGQSSEFAVECIRLREYRPNCYDTWFTVEYMKVLFAQRKLDNTAVKESLSLAKKLMPKTTDPMYSQLLLLSPQTRKYLLQRKYAKLQQITDDRKMIVESNPAHCTGRGAAWVYYNEGRSNALQLDMMTGTVHNTGKSVEIMRERTIESYNRSLQHFNEDKGQDRIYGAAYVKFQLVVLLLRCGCNGLGMSSKTNVPKKDAKIADYIMEQFEGSKSELCPILEMYFSIANCDRMFRKNLLNEALKNAERALSLATENMTEYVQPIQNRVDYLRHHTSQVTKPLLSESATSTEVSYYTTSDNPASSLSLPSVRRQLFSSSSSEI
ncbi:uncharacterized protein LOC132544075 [Ylistrum balloti]|uniref:uncharacterized protein LOC132544075 n=1 Tax=Ylistrum balloti TaxID=509963 RepID=UPI002905B5D7|nr:uncharacterized protein LOC132544075 [Ylistrum balloti]XP_060063625.1 uncharacterized protein LOC132544075 [Ylistrum balloti]